MQTDTISCLVFSAAHHPYSTMSSTDHEEQPNLNLELRAATNDDFDFFLEPLFNTMGRGPFVSALWPRNQDEVGLKRTKERWLKEM